LGELKVLKNIVEEMRLRILKKEKISILNIGSGSMRSDLKSISYYKYNKFSNRSKIRYFVLDLDKKYLNGICVAYAEHLHEKWLEVCKVDHSIYKVKCDIFEFLDNYIIPFDFIIMQRFFEHIPQDELLYFIYLLSTKTKSGSIIDLISPNYKLLAEMIINEKIDDPNFDKNDIIISTEVFNDLNDPHLNITTPERIKRLFEYEGRFEVELECPRMEFDGRNIYFRSVIKRI